MKSYVFLLSLFLLFVGCANSIPLDDEGWPIRKASQRLRCPATTALQDTILLDGSRHAVCKKGDNPLPRGFEIYWYPDGKISSLYTTATDGSPLQKDGYYQDGNKRSEERFSEGKVISSKAWFHEGTLKYEALSHGDETRIRRWSIEGELETEGRLVNGKREGIWSEFVEGAQEKANYVGGSKEGEVIRNYLDGSQEKGSYQEGKKRGAWVRRLNAKNVYQLHYKNNILNGKAVYYYPGGGVKERGAYVDHKKEGFWKMFYPSGQIREHGEFRCDMAHGLWNGFHSLGEKKYQGEYAYGEKIGHWQYWNDSGHLFSAEDYSRHPIPFSCPKKKFKEP